MQNQQTRASAALKLVKIAIQADDQECFDFLTQTIQREQLYVHYQTDAGEPIRNMDAFVADLDLDPDDPRATRVVASAIISRFTPRRLTRGRPRVIRIKVKVSYERIHVPNRLAGVGLIMNVKLLALNRLGEEIKTILDRLLGWQFFTSLSAAEARVC